MHPCLVIRHAAAEEAHAAGLDAERHLSPEGAVMMGRVAAGIAAAAPVPGVILTSPYARAPDRVGGRGRLRRHRGRRRAGARARRHRGRHPRRAGRALPGGPWQRRPRRRLGRFVSYGLAATGRSFHALRKGGACLLEFPALPRAGNATLEWALDPVHLEAMAARARRRDGIMA